MKNIIKKIITNKYLVILFFIILISFLIPDKFALAQADDNYTGDWIGYDWMGNVIAGIGLLFLKLSAFFIWLAGMLLDFVVNVGIVRMGEVIKKQSITDAWAIFRDVVNIFFIFGLLYLSILTIVTGWSDNSKKRLGMIIVSALLINFSFLFTSILVDTSNVLALSFYNNMNGCELATKTLGSEPVPLPDSKIKLEERHITDGGLSLCFMKKLGFSNFLNMKNEDVKKTYKRNGDPMEFLKTLLMISIFLTIAAIVFFAMAVVIFTRFIAIIFILITSPIMFAGGILPMLKKYTDKWVEALTSNLIAIPIMFLFLYISYQLAGTSLFSGVTDIVVAGDSTTGRAAWGSVMSENPASGNGAGFGIILNFIIVISFLIGSIVIGKQAGAMGGEAGMGMAMGLGAFAGKKLIGGTVGKLGGINQRLQKWSSEGTGWRKSVGSRFQNGFMSRGLSDIGNKAAKSTFDIRNTRGVSSLLGAAGLNAGKGSSSTYDKDEKAGAKAIAERRERLGLDGRAADAQVQSDAVENARNNNSEYREAEAELQQTQAQQEKIKQKQKEMEEKIKALKKDAADSMALSQAYAANGEKADADMQKARADADLKEIDTLVDQIKLAEQDEIENNKNIAELKSAMAGIEKVEATKILSNNASQGYGGLIGKINPLMTGRKKAIEDRIKAMYKSDDEKAQADLIKRLSKELEKANAGGGEAPKPEGDKK
jgi:hypothetical protein